MSVSLFIRHQTRPGRRDEVAAIWRTHMAPAVAANSGHEAYSYCFDDADADTIVVYQQYVDDRAARDFLQTPAYLQYLEESEHLLAGPPVVTSARPQWVKQGAA